MPALRRAAAVATATAVLTVPGLAFAQSLSLGSVTISRHATGGKVRGTFSAGPPGAPISVVVKSGGVPVGSRTVTAASGTTRYAVPLSRTARAKLRRHHHLDVAVDASAKNGGASVGAGTSGRVVP